MYAAKYRQFSTNIKVKIIKLIPVLLARTLGPLSQLAYNNFTCGGGGGVGSVGVGWGWGEVALPPLSVEPRLVRKHLQI